MHNPDRFGDLKINNDPCAVCTQMGPHGYKSFFNKFNKKTIEFVDFCVAVITEAIKFSPAHRATLNLAIDTVKNNDDQGSFTQLISTILLADRIRNENLFDLLPFKDYAIQQLFKNQ